MQIEQTSRRERKRERERNNVAHLIKINVIKIKANKRQSRRLVCDSERGLLNEDTTPSRGVVGTGEGDVQGGK